MESKSIPVMSKLSVTYEDYVFVVRKEDETYGWIAFDKGNLEATINVAGKTLRAERGDDKNIVLKEAGKDLFTFKFDYLWGGAELLSYGKDTGFDIKGRWFKPGTRLTDDQDNDLVVAVKKGNGMDVTIADTEVSPVMVMATIYYHIYSSAGKMLSVLAGSVGH